MNKERPDILKGIKFPALAQEIEKMLEEDQAMRERALKNKGIIESKEDDTLDQRNAERMKQIIEESGWPSTLKVGQEAARAAWLLVLHADHDVVFQKMALELMNQEEGVEEKDIAYLEDRVRVNEGKLQIYGTQFRPNARGEYNPLPIEDVENVNKRRIQMGLGTLEEGIVEYHEKYKDTEAQIEAENSESAREEAMYLQNMVGSGKAKDYTDAENQFTEAHKQYLKSIAKSKEELEDESTKKDL